MIRLFRSAAVSLVVFAAACASNPPVQVVDTAAEARADAAAKRLAGPGSSLYEDPAVTELKKRLAGTDFNVHQLTGRMEHVERAVANVATDVRKLGGRLAEVSTDPRDIAARQLAASQANTALNAAERRENGRKAVMAALSAAAVKTVSQSVARDDRGNDVGDDVVAEYRDWTLQMRFSPDYASVSRRWHRTPRAGSQDATILGMLAKPPAGQQPDPALATVFGWKEDSAAGGTPADLTNQAIGELKKLAGNP